MSNQMKLPTRFSAVLLAALASLAVPAPAAAQLPDKAPARPTMSDIGHAFKNALTEEETRLLLEYMRDSVLAAFKDEEVTLPPDLAFKLEVLMQRLKKEGNFYLDNLVKQLEADIKRSLKEKMEPKPPVPYTPPEVPLLVPAMTTPATLPAPAANAPAPAAAPVPTPTNFSPPPWGWVPWFYVPQPTYQVPAYTPPEVPRFVPPAAPPAPNGGNKTK
jgi:hypothetical protein